MKRTVTVTEILAALLLERRRIAQELADLRAADCNIIPIEAGDLQLIELAGYTVDLSNGIVEPVKK
jgi:hypothetical protein